MRPVNLGSLSLGKGISPFSPHFLSFWGERTLPGVLAAMGPRLPLLVAALASCLLPARTCVLCDTKVVEALNSLEMDYLPGHLGAEHHKNLMKRVKQALQDFKDLPFDEDSYLGVVGEGKVEPGPPVLGKEGSGARIAGGRGKKAAGRVSCVREWNRLWYRFRGSRG